MTKCAPPKNRLRNSIPVSLGVFVAIGSLAFGAQEQIEVPSRPLSLKDCIALALNESPLLDASRLDVASATEAARAARGQALPEITASGSAQLFSGSPTSKFLIVNSDSSTIVGNPNRTPVDRSVSSASVEIYSAHLSYPLFRDGSILGLNTGPAEASQLARKRNLSWTSKMRREDVISRITDAFITTVSAENRAGYAERRVKLFHQQVEITEEQQKQGLMRPAMRWQG